MIQHLATSHVHWISGFILQFMAIQLPYNLSALSLQLKKDQWSNFSLHKQFCFTVVSQKCHFGWHLNSRVQLTASASLEDNNRSGRPIKVFMQTVQKVQRTKHVAYLCH